MALRQKVADLLLRQDFAPLADARTQWERASYPKDSLYIELICQQALGEFLAGNPDGAIRFQQQALAAAGKTPYLLSKVNYRYGVFAFRKKELDKSKQLLQQSIEQGRTYNQFKWVANSCAHLAFIFYNEGEYYHTIALSDVGIQSALRAGDPVSLEKNRLQKANALKSLRDIPGALKVIDQVKSEATSQSDFKIIYNSGVYLNGILNNFPAAAAYYGEAQAMYRQNPTWKILGTRISWTFVLTKQKKYQQALALLKELLPQAETPEDKSLILTNLADVMVLLGRFPEALRYYQQSFRELTGMPGMENTLKNPSPASIQRSTRKEYLFTVVTGKAAALLAYYSGKPDRSLLVQALDTYRVADRMIDFMRQEHTEIRSKLHWRTETKAVYEGALATCLALGQTEQAFYFLEKSRAILLSDRLNELSASQRLSASDSRKELQFRQQLNILREQFDGGSPVERNQISSRLDSLTQAQQTFIRSLEKTNPAYFRYKYDNHVPSLRAVRDSLLEDGQAFVTYFLGDSVCYSLGVTKTGTIFKKWPLGNYTVNAQAFLRLCSQPFRTVADAQQFQHVSYGLYRQLLEPLKLGQVSRFVVSQDGAFLPFEALLASASKNDYLLRHHAFSYTYSAGFLLRRREEGDFGRHFLGIAPERFASALGQQPLPGSVEALTRVETHVSSPRHFVREEATKRNFLEQAADFRILQLFTHADADSTETREPVLYFADSALRLSELDATRQFRTQLLVLSACKTSVGVDQKGEGVFSLARGFAALGIPSIVTTLWSVEDRATYNIIGSFYKYLAQGLPQDVALQKARQEALSTDSQPYYWSGLIHIGETRPVPLSAVTWWYWAGGGLVIMAGAWAFRRRKRAISSPRRES